MPNRSLLRSPWDGLLISEEPPHGATIVVFRRGAVGAEYLVLHRAASGAGPDWAWGPPAGPRLPGEAVLDCATRELDEETGLRLDLTEVPLDPAWAAFWTEAPAAAPIRLSVEHDRYEWVGLDEAVRRCQPRIVGEQFEMLAQVSAA